MINKGEARSVLLGTILLVVLSQFNCRELMAEDWTGRDIAQPNQGRSLITKQLEGSPEANAVRTFCLGIRDKDFGLAMNVINDYAVQRQKLNQSLPASVAEKRFNEMMVEQKKRFEAGMGPFYVGTVAAIPIQQFFQKEAFFQVTDIKPGSSFGTGTATFKNVFIRIEYPENVAPKSGVKRLKSTYLVIPASNGWVLASPRYGDIDESFPFSPKIKRMTDVDEFWEVGNKEKLLGEAITPTRELLRFKYWDNIVYDRYPSEGVIYDTHLVMDRRMGQTEIKRVVMWFGDMTAPEYSEQRDYYFRGPNSKISFKIGGPWIFAEGVDIDFGKDKPSGIGAYNVLKSAMSDWVAKYGQVVSENRSDPIFAKKGEINKFPAPLSVGVPSGGGASNSGCDELFSHSGGRFCKKGSNWEEINAEGVHLFFNESGRDSQWIALFDASRNVCVKLPASGEGWSLVSGTGPSGPWGRLYEVRRR